jgi:signal transduction histidine kinase
LLLVSLVSLSVLWAFAASVALGDGLNLRNVKTVQEHFGYPSGALGSALQAERRLTVVYLGSKAAGDRAAMESGRLVTDRQADLFRRLAADKGAQGAAPAQAKQLANDIISRLNELAGKRTAIDAGSTSRSRAFTNYTGILGDIGTLQGSLSTLSNPEVDRDARSQVALTRARETLSQEDALLAGTLAARRMTPVEHAAFIKLVGTQRSLYNLSVLELREADRVYYQQVTTTPEYNRLRSLEDMFVRSPRAIRAGNGMDVVWKTTADSNLTRLRGLELSLSAEAESRAAPIANAIILRVVLAGALGLIAVVASLVLAIWVARSVIRELTGLKREALDLANVRLPSVIQRLRRGEEVDVAAEAPPLSFGTEEIDQVGEAFNAARRTAIQGAVEEAALRRSVSDVFVNLARRSQALLHRQLKLLDSMERRGSDPDELEDLFRLDHLATRMRRHAEGLIILSGQAPGRGWRNPVAVVDIARAAASEVEDYTRVSVAPMSQASITGTAVADVIHLLAELIENATMFSPPHTTVQVTGETVGHGFTLEIEDRGLSMDPESLTRANERLAAPPEFDLSDSAQLGLFVVGRLAQRHKIKVTLRTSPYGGMTAIVLLPEDIVVRGEEHAADGRPLALTRRSEEALVPVGAIRADGHGSPVPGGGMNGPVLSLYSGEPTPEVPRPAPHRRPEPVTSPRAERPFDQPVQATHRGQPNHPEQGRGRPNPPQPNRRQPNPPPQPNPPQSFERSRPAPQPFGWSPPAPQPFERPQPAPEPAESQPPQRLPDAGQRPPVGRRRKGGSKPPLPRRVRQANLAPQLYEDSGSTPPADTEADKRRERSPEELRTMMSSIRKGTLRGRSEAVENDEGP